MLSRIKFRQGCHGCTATATRHARHLPQPHLSSSSCLRASHPRGHLHLMLTPPDSPPSRPHSTISPLRLPSPPTFLPRFIATPHHGGRLPGGHWWKRSHISPPTAGIPNISCMTHYGASKPPGPREHRACSSLQGPAPIPDHPF